MALLTTEAKGRHADCVEILNTWLLKDCPKAIVPQLSKCLKFEAVWGVLADQII